MFDFSKDSRFQDLIPFTNKIWLSSPTMHGEELVYMKEAFDTNWMSTVGKNINEIEEAIEHIVGIKHAIALSSGTAALHLAIKLAAERIYNSSSGVSTPDGLGAGGSLYGKRAFCSDMTFSATVNPILYEGGEPIFIDTELDTWNMDPIALEKAFKLYPDVKIIVLAHLYGVPGKIDEIKEIAQKHGAVIVEDAAESFGAKYKGRQTGTFGDFNAISFNGNKIITGSSGGMLLLNNDFEAEKVRKWSTQSREAAPWYQHEELGYNYRMSNVIAGVVRGQLSYLDTHIEQKRRIYERYKEGLSDLPVSLNCFDPENSQPNYWLSALIINRDYLSESIRGEKTYQWTHEKGKSSPSEILDALSFYNAEGRPIWKPMHLQPLYRMHSFVTRDGNGRARSNAYISGNQVDVGGDIFERGLCLPSDNKMTADEQDIIIEIIHRCFV